MFSIAWSVSHMSSIDEKTTGRKSGWTVPMKVKTASCSAVDLFTSVLAISLG